MAGQRWLNGRAIGFGGREAPVAHPSTSLSDSLSRTGVLYLAHMRTRWWIAISVLGGGLLLLAIGWAQREPAYQGKPLHVWLKGFESDSD